MGKITKWEECGRDDLAMIPRMINAGFVPEFNWNDKTSGRTVPENAPHYDVKFRDPKTELHAWKCYNSGVHTEYWSTATLDNGNYVNHEPFKSLEEMLVIKGYEK